MPRSRAAVSSMPGAGLRQSQVASILTERVGRMVRAEVDAASGAPAVGKFVAHPGRQLVELVLGVQTATDAGLVRDNDQREPQIMQAARAFQHTRHEHEVLASTDVAAIDVDDAIAVKEGGTSEGCAGAVHSGCFSSQRT